MSVGGGVLPGPVQPVRAPEAKTSWRDRLSGTSGLALFLLVLVGVISLLQPSFLTPANIANVLVQSAPLGFVVIGQTIVILVRGLDLSVASVMATVAVLATSFNATSNRMVVPIAAAGLALGLGVGLVNGLLVVKRGISPFLATLAVMVMLQGARFAYTKGAPSGSLPSGFATISTGSVGGVPISVLVLAVVAALAWFLLSRTPTGRELYLIGDNPRAARLAGIGVGRVTLLAYVLSGTLAAAGGLLLMGYVGIVDNWTGRGYELNSIAAAIMGGASLRGGRGTVLGSLLGALILVTIFNMVLMLGLSVEFQMIIKGVIIVAASAFYLARR